MTTERDEASSAKDFESLRVTGRRLAETGRLDEALATYEEALTWARDEGSPEEVELALCNRAAVLIYTERGAAEIPGLRQILIGSPSPTNRYYAAYQISLFYDNQKAYSKAMRYGQLALDYAQRLGDPRLVARSRNLLGNALLAESYFESARGEYRQALELLPEATDLDRALVLDNRGYCDVVLGAYGDGFGGLFESLRMLRRLGAGEWVSVVHLDLAFAYLEVERFDDARRHALKAFERFDGRRESKHLKNCLYLLGETEKHAGHFTAARSYFERLQGEFFPDNLLLARMLMGVDVRKMINLKA